MNRRLKGYFTVEVTLLMMIILPFLTVIILTGFYLHDCARMQGIVCEIAANGSCLMQYDDRASILNRKKEGLIRSGFTWTKGIHAELEISDDVISVACGGEFVFPVFTGEFMSAGSRNAESSWNRKLYHPADLIRKVRGIKKFADMVSSNE